ncbi:dipicolinate synthase subunit B [Tannockella kyphosi]|uniref:dipicolinate synthase subunit B n=1 Tax=Tannockella kyphosi TaxID=2899121 RepID=UPI0020130D1A|nr:dipicolinate synthase subunit B [Tannockella kyphosi]
MLTNKKIGLAITGSFCSMNDMLEVIDYINKNHGDLYVLFSDTIRKYDTRFNKSSELIKQIERRIKRPIIDDIVQAEKFGPIEKLDLMIVYPCSGNTLAKLATGINDNAVTMGCKATLRNQRNILIGLCTNDALSTSGKNLMQLLNTKQYYFIPMIQDNVLDKPNSMIASIKHLAPSIECALLAKQVQPVFIGDSDA